MKVKIEQTRSLGLHALSHRQPACPKSTFCPVHPALEWLDDLAGRYVAPAPTHLCGSVDQVGRAPGAGKPALPDCAHWLTALLPCAVGLDHSDLARPGLLRQQPVRLGRRGMQQRPRDIRGLVQPGRRRPAGGLWPADRAHRPEPGRELFLGCVRLAAEGLGE